jgi:MFS family permease
MRNFGKTVLDLFRTRSLCLYFFGEGILCFMTVSVLAWAPALLMRVMNMSEATAGLIVGGWGLMAIIAAPLGGWLADLWQKKTGRGRLHMPALTAVLASIVLITMVSMRFGPVGIGLGFLYGILTVISIPASNAFTQDVVPAANKGLAVGLGTFCAYIFGGAWGPTIVGTVSDAIGGGADGLTYAVLLTSIGGFIGGILLWLAARTYPADMARIKSETMITG